MSPHRSTRPIKGELQRLMRWHELSFNKFARQLGVSAAHVSRCARADRPETFSGELAGKAAVIFGLPEDYFPEFRRDFLLELVRSDAELRDQLYDTAQRLLAEGREDGEAEAAAVAETALA